ncbi:MAG: NUDIX hydrolase [Pseudomonadales bacterium]
MPETVTHPSATVVLLRDSAQGMQTLLLLRNKKVRFGGGEWVFPGGKIEPAELAAHDALDDAERAAAVRECHEEAGIVLSPAALQKYSHWITPDIMPQRFSTGFYLVALEHEPDIVIDNSEIVDYRWLSPGEALQQHGRGELAMMPPTFVSLCDLASYAAPGDILQRCAATVPPLFEPRVVREETGVCLLYAGDCGYDAIDSTLQGKRHRLLMRASCYEYICELTE